MKPFLYGKLTIFTNCGVLNAIRANSSVILHVFPTADYDSGLKSTISNHILMKKHQFLMKNGAKKTLLYEEFAFFTNFNAINIEKMSFSEYFESINSNMASAKRLKIKS